MSFGWRADAKSELMPNGSEICISQYLWSRSKSLSIHPFDEAIKIDPNCRILYR